MLNRLRLSNIESLRIIAIMMVLMLHFNRVWHSEVLQCGTTFSWPSFEGNLIESLCIAAVNVFVMISGYFSIKLSIRSILNLYIRCFIIGLVTYLAYILIVNEPLSVSSLGGRLFAFTHNCWWFVISYLGLMAISPILNAGSEALSKRYFLGVLVAFSIAMLYFGWYKQLENTHEGYSLIHFIYLYIIARYLKLHVSEQTICKFRWAWLALYVILVCLMILLVYVAPIYQYTYNNPITIVQAICLLCFFISIPFHNRFINWVSTSVFSAYLIQESPYLGQLWLYPRVSEMFTNGACGGRGDVIRSVYSSTANNFHSC